MWTSYGSSPAVTEHQRWRLRNWDPKYRERVFIIWPTAWSQLRNEISYRACFKPQLPEFFIERLTKPGDTVSMICSRGRGDDLPHKRR